MAKNGEEGPSWIDNLELWVLVLVMLLLSFSLLAGLLNGDFTFQ